MHLPDASSPVALAGQRTANAVEAERTKVQNLVAEFESMLIAQMLRGLKDAMAPEADEGGLGGAIMGDTVTTELAAALGRSGGLGLSELVSTALARVEAGTAPAGVIAPTMATPPAHDGMAHAGDPVAGVATDGGTVTSAFGWRADPLHGARRFHAGADLRAAYGQPILAATGGVVTAVGERAGYGLIVTVDHGNGLETRYAHLSSAAVQVGARVEAGEVIAQAGATGRATAPHLHFEVRRDGAPIDPTRIDGLGPVVG